MFRTNVARVAAGLSALALLAPSAASAPAGAADGSLAFAQRTDLNIVVGSPTGAWMRAATAVFEAAKRDIRNFDWVPVQGGGLQNPITLSTARPLDRYLGFGFGPMFTAAYQGEAPFDKTHPSGIKNLRAVANLGGLIPGQLVIRREKLPAGVTTVEDLLKARPSLRWGVEGGGSAHQISFGRLLKAYGLMTADLQAWGGRVVNATDSDLVGQMGDGFLDAVWAMTNQGRSELVELARARDVVFMPIGKTAVDFFVKLGYRPYTMPPNVYRNQAQPVETVTEPTWIVTNDQMGDEVVYKLTLFLLRNQSRWLEADRAIFGTFEPATAFETTLPLHPGAARAYRELGFMR